MCKNTCVCALLCVRVRVCVCVCVLFLKKVYSVHRAKKKTKVMKLTNLQRAIIASCALILLLGACALIAKAEWGRSLILVVPAIVGLLVADGKKQIK